MAHEHVSHLQQFQGLLEAVKIALGGGSEKGGNEVTTVAGAQSILANLGRG